MLRYFPQRNSLAACSSSGCFHRLEWRACRSGESPYKFQSLSVSHSKFIKKVPSGRVISQSTSAFWLLNPVSACIGPHGDRVAAVVEKLGGEKIDIVKWSEDVSEFISAALSPAKVLKVELLPGETRSCRVTVPDQQLSLAIGNKGQNARLCARLTGYNIDIRPESGYYGEDEEPKAAEPKTEDAE